jgi:hypothetical protein
MIVLWPVVKGYYFMQGATCIGECRQVSVTSWMNVLSMFWGGKPVKVFV